MNISNSLLLTVYLIQTLKLGSIKSSKECGSPLGLIDGRIYDWQLSASSNDDTDPNCDVRYCRIHSWPGRGWCPSTNSTERQYLQIDFGIQTGINGVITQGRADGKSWTKTYRIVFSNDAINWFYYNSGEILSANRDSNTLHFIILKKLIWIRFLRIEVVDSSHSGGLRIELLGCRRCDQIINYPPRSVTTASSSKDWPREEFCSAQDSYIDGSVGWCAKWNNHHQWITVDVGPPALIVGVITRGSGIPLRRHWVSSYSISYSNDSLRWTFYKDDNNLTKIRKFEANMDKQTRRWHYFNRPIIARFIRFNPITWKTRISMRIGIIGCLDVDICPNGFFRINDNSECVPNLSYLRNTWINDKRHSWSDWEFGHSNHAVDGDVYDKSLNKCALLDNYFVETPIWMVDLGQLYLIHGVVVVSWPQHYKQNNIEKLTIIYEIKSKSFTHLNQSEPQINICGTISVEELNKWPRIQISCGMPAIGRYVYIIANGKDHQSRMLFSAILCEVYVY